MGSEGSQGREQYVNRRYRVVRPLGTGGMGMVYLVQDTLDEDQLLALKTIRAGVTSSFSYRAFRNEFQAMTQFRHPNVVEVYEFGTLGPHEDFFTMEVVEGHNLLDATEHAPLERIYDYFVQAGRALEYIHSQGFIHFDLKPDNIMVRGDGTVKVMDFGLVEDFAHISQDAVRGSVHYLAPEMVRGHRVDHRFDLYSLGAVMFHVIAGRPLHDGTVAEVLHHHVHSEPDFETGVRRPFPPDLRDLLGRLLAKEPAQRIATASDFLVEMERLAGGHTDAPGRDLVEGTDSYVLGSRFVGREAELARLKDAFERRVVRVEADVPPLVFVAGPAGIGRSRLLQELRHHVQLRGVRFAHGSSLEAGGQPYLPFSEIIRALLREILPSGEGEELTSFRQAGGSLPTAAARAPASESHPRALSATVPRHDDAAVAITDELPPPQTVLIRPRSRYQPAAPAALIESPGGSARSDDSGEGAPESSSLGVIYPERASPEPTAHGETAAEQAARVHERLVEALRPGAAALSRLLPDHDGLRALATAAPAFSGPRAEKEWLMASISRFLVDAARVRPLVLYLSDLHWGDELTIELLGRLARDLAATGHEGEPSRFLLLGCHRSEAVAGTPLQNEVRALAAEGLASVIDLPPLGEGELLKMVQSMLGPVALSERASRILLERSGGSPFLIEATVRGLLERGLIRRAGSAFEVADLSDDAIGGAMATFEEVLDRTIERLQPAELALLHLLAVFNRPTSSQVLQAAAPFIEQLPRQLSRLQRKRFLQRGWADGSYQYRLRHNQLRAHLYKSLDPGEQARLHEAAGNALEAHSPHGERYFEDLAQHFQRAGNLEKTFLYTRAAGGHARRLFDMRRAAALFTQAHDLLDRLPGRADRRRNQAELAVAIAESSSYLPSEANLERLQHAATVASELSDRHLANQIQNWMGRTFYALGRQRDAIRCFQEFIVGISGTGDDFTRALPFTVLGRVFFFLGRFEATREYLSRGISLLRPVSGTDEDLAYALGMQGAAHAFLGDLAGGLERIDESLAIARRIDHPTRIALGFIYRGICLAHHGRWEAARSDLDEGLARCARTGDAIGTATGSSFRGQIELAGGHAGEAVRLARHGKEVIARTGGTWTLTVIGSHLADALLAMGDIDAAEGAARDALQIVESGEHWGESSLRVAFGRIHAARGDVGAARSSMSAAIEVAHNQHARPAEARARMALGGLLHVAGKPEEGRGELETAAHLFRELGMEWHRERAERLLAGDDGAGWCP